MFWQDRLEAVADRLIVCTDDGSAGRSGLVSEALAEVVATDRPDRVVAIGPMPMMRAMAADAGMARETSVSPGESTLSVSLEVVFELGR